MSKQLNTEQLVYCDCKCPLGIKRRNEFLNSSNSAFDAALDMRDFVENCAKTCNIMKYWEELNINVKNN